MPHWPDDSSEWGAERSSRCGPECCPECGAAVPEPTAPGSVSRCPACEAWLYRSLWEGAPIAAGEETSFATEAPDAALPAPCPECGSARERGRCRPCATERRRRGALARVRRHLLGGGAPPAVLPLAAIDPDAAELRRSLDVRRFERLRRAIAATGIVSPIIVRPLAAGDYAIVDGFRRYLAIRHLGRPAIAVHVVALDEGEAARWRLAANLHREALSDLEEAEAFARAGRAHTGSRAALAGSLGLDALRLGRMFERFRADPRAREEWLYREDDDDPEVIARERRTLDEIRRAAGPAVERTT